MGLSLRLLVIIFKTNFESLYTGCPTILFTLFYKQVLLKIVQDFKDWAKFDQVMKKILTEEENKKLFKIKALGEMWAEKL